MKKTSTLDWSILTGLVIAWGSSFAMTKVAVAHLDAAWIMALRLSVAGLVLAPYAMFCGESFFASGDVWRKFTWLAFIGHAAPFFLITWGTHYVSSGISGLLMGAVPLFLVVLAHFFLDDEPLTVPKSAGFLLGFIGIVVLIGPDKLLSLSMSGEALWGDLAILAGCLCYAAHGVTAKRLGFENPLKQSACVCVAAAAMGLAFAAGVSPAGLLGKPQLAYWAVIGLGLLPTAFATLLMYRLMNRMGPSFVAYSNYLVPVYAVLFGALTLGEELSWNILAALVLILTGIAISRLNRLPKAK